MVKVYDKSFGEWFDKVVEYQEKHLVYIMWDGDTAIYVGCTTTFNIKDRMRQHRRDDWVQDYVTRVSVFCELDDKANALKHEGLLIQDLQPIFNRSKLNAKPKPKGRFERNIPNRKVGEKDRENITTRYVAGETLQCLADEYKISKQLASVIIRENTGYSAADISFQRRYDEQFRNNFSRWLSDTP